MGFKDKFKTKQVKIKVSYKLDGMPFNETYDSMPEASSAKKQLMDSAKNRKQKLTDWKAQVTT